MLCHAYRPRAYDADEKVYIFLTILATHIAELSN